MCKQGIVYLVLAVGYVSLLLTLRVGYPRLKRGLAVLACICLVSGMLVTFGSDSRRVASALNQVLPHVELEVNRSWRVPKVDVNTAKNGMAFRLFEVTLTNRWARGVDVEVYNFEFESGSARYDNTFAPEFRGCDLQDVSRNGTLTCLIALELPQTTTGGTLVFRNSSYEAWADVSF